MSKRSRKRRKNHPNTPKIGLIRAPSKNDYCFCLSGKKFKDCCQKKHVVFLPQSKEKINLLEIAGVKIYRPRTHIEIPLISQARNHLLEKFKPGIYTEFQLIDSIFKRQVDFFGDYFDSLISKLASRDFVQFLMWQYDQTGILDALHADGKLKLQALKEWKKIGPTFRRALKYMIERTTMLSPEEIQNEYKSELIDFGDEATICAEELINYCILSDQTRLFHANTRVEVTDTGEINHTISDTRILNLEQRQAKFKEDKKTIFGDSVFPSDISTHADFLDESLKDTIGSSYREALQILCKLGSGVNTLHDGFPVVFVRKSDVEKKLAEIFGKTEADIRNVLVGFTINKEDMIAEGRDYWNPQFHYRAFRRGMFQLPHETGTHLAWGKSLFEEALVIMTNEVSFGQFPNEWRSKDIDSKLGLLTVEQGKWFESLTMRQLEKLNIQGLCSRVSIGTGKFAINIDAGELDFIGWSIKDNSLILLECKMLQHGSEPKKWKNSIDCFLIDKKKQKSFLTKLSQKASWIKDNFEAVCDALRSENISVNPGTTKLKAAFVTFAPEAASYFVKEFPCIALNELVSEYNAIGKWPYQSGTFDLNHSQSII